MKNKLLVVILRAFAVPWLIVTLGAYFNNGFDILIPDLLLLFQGDIFSIRVLPFVTIVPVMCAIFSVYIIFLVAYILISEAKKLSRTGENEISKLSKYERFKLLRCLLGAALWEEIYARWIFLELLPEIFSLSETHQFIGLFLIGNSLWSIKHLNNFKDKKDRKIIRVLPQFVLGFFLSYVYIKYGLVGAILTHFTWNAVLLIQRQNKKTDRSS